MEKVRTKDRGKSEAFTPNILVNEILDSLPDTTWVEGKTFLDPECGTGNFLVAIAERKLELGHNSILDTIYGTDIMQDNVDECRERLLTVCGDTKLNRSIVKQNIRCENTLEYDYSYA
jgi:type I restriction-modification system DNA methylase subunit